MYLRKLKIGQQKLRNFIHVGEKKATLSVRTMVAGQNFILSAVVRVLMSKRQTLMSILEPRKVRLREPLPR